MTRAGNAAVRRKPAGLILAAGYSSRMNALKALYPVGEELVIQRAVRVLFEAGIENVLIVTGYKKQLIETVLEGFNENYKNRITLTENPDYDDGMFSSVLTGVKALADISEGFLMLPVDYPFVKAETIRALVSEFDTSEADIISPFCDGRKGHPPVIRNTVFSSILEYQKNIGAERGPAGGLASILENPRFSTRTTETADCGVLDDMDDDWAYIRLLKKYTGIELKYPAAAELEMLIRAKSPGSRTVTHMEKTAELAVELAEKLNACGCRLQPGLIYSAAMLHDVCRAEPDHAEAAAEYIRNSGYPVVGEIVGRHMNITHNEDDSLDEAAVLYLADKMMEGDKLTGLSVRMESKLKQFAGNQAALENIKTRFEKAFLIRRKVEKILKPRL